MDDDWVVRLDDVSLRYRLSRSAPTSLKEFALSLVRGQIRYESLTALDGVSLEVRRGEVLGVVGNNGAGKSTLLKLIARVISPSTGRVRVVGNVAPMIELGAGFNPDLTGRENIVLYGTLLGRNPSVMRARVADISAWAELDGFMDVPIRSYSSGMVARLAFAVAVDSEPDVLLVDEVLSVGDEAFQRRSLERIEQIIEAGTAVVLVSHSLSQVMERATRAVWLAAGRVAAEGDPSEVVRAYRNRGIASAPA